MSKVHCLSKYIQFMLKHAWSAFLVPRSRHKKTALSCVTSCVGEDTEVLSKADYSRVILVPIIAYGALIALIGYLIKTFDLYLLKVTIESLGVHASEDLFNLLGNLIFFIFLIYGIFLAVVKVIRTTGIELAATKDLLVERHGKDAMRVPLEKVENFAIYKNIIGKIFNFGTVYIGTPSVSMKFPFIVEPEKFRDSVLELQKKAG